MADADAINWPVANHLCARVLPRQRAALVRQLEHVQLGANQMLYMPGDAQTHVYFPTSAMISLVAMMNDGRTAEVATIGREGAAAISASGYVDPAFVGYVVHVPGDACRIEAAAFEDMVDTSVEFCSAIARWRDVLLRMTMQSVACNALHNVRQRCARWILTTHDRVGSDQFGLTQEALAQMLGVKRNAVNIVARELQQAGAIVYARGRVTIVDRAVLATYTCDCHALVLREVARIAADLPSPECDD